MSTPGLLRIYASTHVHVTVSAKLRDEASPPRQLKSIAQAADYLGVSTKTIRRYIAAGRVTGLRSGPKLIRIDVAELDALLRPIPNARSGEGAA